MRLSCFCALWLKKIVPLHLFFYTEYAYNNEIQPAHSKTGQCM